MPYAQFSTASDDLKAAWISRRPIGANALLIKISSSTVTCSVQTQCPSIHLSPHKPMASQRNWWKRRPRPRAERAFWGHLPTWLTHCNAATFLTVQMECYAWSPDFWSPRTFLCTIHGSKARLVRDPVLVVQLRWWSSTSSSSSWSFFSWETCSGRTNARVRGLWWKSSKLLGPSPVIC